MCFIGDVRLGCPYVFIHLKAETKNTATRAKKTTDLYPDQYTDNCFLNVVFCKIHIVVSDKLRITL